MEATGLRLRESQRVAVAGKARVQLGAVGMTADATVLDLSITGMGLATAVAAPRFPVGDACTFELTLDGVRIEGSGAVVWSRRARPDRGDAPNLGVRFQRLVGTGPSDVALVVERELAARQRYAFTAPAAAVAGDDVAGVPVSAVEQQQLSLPAVPLPPQSALAEGAAEQRASTDAGAMQPPASSAGSAVVASVASVASVAFVTPAPPRAAAAEPAPQQPARIEAVLAPALVERTTRGPAIEPAPPAATPQTRLDPGPGEATPPSRGRTALWLGLIAAAFVIAILVWSIVPRRREPGAAVDRSTSVSAEPSAQSASAPDVAATADLEAAPAEEEAAAAVSIAEESTESRPIDAAVEPAISAATDSAPPDAAPPAADAPTGARRLLALEPTQDGAGELVTLRFDAPLQKDDVFAALIGPDPPRYLLRLRGIEKQWRPADLEVRSPLVQRVRTGLHTTPRGKELHIVIDLSTRVIEHAWEIDGDTLRVHLTPRSP